jgi:hypothetical protein
MTVRENHYKQCWYNETGECVCRAVQEAMESWDEYTESELEAERIRGRFEGMVASLVLFGLLTVALFSVWLVL